MTAKDLAEAHWSYVKSLLEAHGEAEATVELIGFHYCSSFLYGFKHGVESVPQLKDFSRMSGLLREALIELNRDPNNNISLRTDIRNVLEG